MAGKIISRFPSIMVRICVIGAGPAGMAVLYQVMGNCKQKTGVLFQKQPFLRQIDRQRSFQSPTLRPSLNWCAMTSKRRWVAHGTTSGGLEWMNMGRSLTAVSTGTSGQTVLRRRALSTLTTPMMNTGGNLFRPTSRERPSRIT